ncbi:MAG: TIM-barrel domain-containing protein, partial [Flavobacteriaceae bacterium]
MITNTEIEKRGNQYPNHVVDFKQENDKLYFTTQNGVILEITILRDSAIRFRYATEHVFEPDFSYAISDDVSLGYNELEVKEEIPEYVITTSKIKIFINKSSLKVQLEDLEGNILVNDELGFHWEENYNYGGNIVKMSKICHSGESYYGMGDKASHTNLKGKRVNNWATDSYAYGKDQEPLYKSIPFYVGLKEEIAYGIFFDNSFSTYFDFANEKRNVTSFWADGGEMNYYFFYGPKMNQVVEAYTDLTGVPELPPLWALGFHQSKWSYYPEKKVKDIASTFRKLRIPCDAIYLDIDYMEGFRCFTWDNKHFPNPKKMIEELEEDGFKTITMIDPGIKIDRDYWVYQQAMDNGFFCRRADGPHFKGKVWPGECKFPDFTDPEVREWWAGLYKEMIADMGV